jgi:hypothetical protein
VDPLISPMTVTALYVTILFCADGSGATNGVCKDGSVQQSHNMHFISRPPNGGKEILFEFDENNVPKFTLYPDGSIRRAGDFSVDDAALAFWRAIALTYKEACPDLSVVLDPLTKKGETK